MIRALRPITKADTVVLLGDYIDRGPNSKEVLDTILKLKDDCNLVTIMGNHEEMLIASMTSRSDLDFWLKFGGLETLESYGPVGGWDTIPSAHIRLIKSCRDYYETETHIFVHAGYRPDSPMDGGIGNGISRWEHPDFHIIRPHISGKTVVVGHSAQGDGLPLDLGFVKCIDTCCHGGQWLTAYIAETNEFIQADESGRVRDGLVKTKPMSKH